MPKSVYDLATEILGREAVNGNDYNEADLPMFGGCQRCEASIAAYNSFPSKTNYLQCKGCIGDDGFETLEEFQTWMGEHQDV